MKKEFQPLRDCYQFWLSNGMRCTAYCNLSESASSGARQCTTTAGLRSVIQLEDLGAQHLRRFKLVNMLIRCKPETCSAHVHYTKRAMSPCERVHSVLARLRCTHWTYSFAVLAQPRWSPCSQLSEERI
eukprot:1624556-Amphidinium_carterae.1